MGNRTVTILLQQTEGINLTCVNYGKTDRKNTKNRRHIQQTYTHTHIQCHTYTNHINFAESVTTEDELMRGQQRRQITE